MDGFFGTVIAHYSKPMKLWDIMTMIVRSAFLIVMLTVTVPARAQIGPTPPQPPAWFTNIPPGFTNAFNNWSNSFAWGTNFWWTNGSVALTNAPPGRTNNPPSHFVPPGGSPAPKLSTDVQGVVQQFQQVANQLKKDLNSANDAQRQQILQQLETLREQLVQQLQTIRANLSQQTLEMQGQFNNQFGPISRGPGSSGNRNGNTSGGGPHKH